MAVSNGETAAFHALVDEYVRGYPVRGRALSVADVHFTAAKLLLHKSREPSSEVWTDGTAVRQAACMFTLFVQEHLVCSQQWILGTRVQEFYQEMQSLLTDERATDLVADFTSAVAAVDTTNAATELLLQPGVFDAIRCKGDLDALWSSAARGALQTVDEMTVYSDHVESINASSIAEDEDMPSGVHGYTDGYASGVEPPGGASGAYPDRILPSSPIAANSSHRAHRSAARSVFGSLTSPERRRVSRTAREGFGEGGDSFSDVSLVPSQQQDWLSRRFRDAKLERAFEDYFYAVWASWIKVQLYVTLAGVLAINGIYWLKPSGPHTGQTYPGFVGDDSALGPTYAAASMLLPLLWCGVICVAVSSNRFFSPRKYVTVLALASVGLVTMFGIPVHVVDVLVALDSQPNSRWHRVQQILANCSEPSHLDMRMLEMGPHAAMHASANRAAAHVFGALLTYVWPAFFSPSPLIACGLLSCILTTNLFRSRFLFRYYLCLDPIRDMSYYHAGGVLIALLVATTQSHVMRRQFLMRLELQRIKDLRIEQLDAEKERLDYERAFALNDSLQRKRAGEHSDRNCQGVAVTQPSDERDGPPSERSGGDGRAADATVLARNGATHAMMPYGRAGEAHVVGSSLDAGQVSVSVQPIASE